jgi:cytochrome c biogenesis protein
MAKEKTASSAALGWLASLKLTLVLFFVLAGASIIGTLLPQGAALSELREHFGPATASLINLLSLNNLYHSAWFSLLLLALCANLTACTADRLPKTIRLLRSAETPFDSRKLSRFSLSGSVSTDLPVDDTWPIVEKKVLEAIGRMRPTGPEPPAGEGPVCAVSETGRWSSFMVYLVHMSVLIILLGALAGSLLGFKGYMNLTEGQSSSEVMPLEGEKVRELPFLVRCDKFEVSFYDTGAPKEFKSLLSIVENGREILKRSIVVNDPLTYEGITFYQASYGKTLKVADLVLTEADSGKEISMTLPFRQPVNIPGTDSRLMIADYQDDLMGLGAAMELVCEKEGNWSSPRWILIDRPYHGNRIENYMVRVTQMDKTTYTGLEIKKDPGVWLVWAGFVLMTLSIGLTFYSSHRKLWVSIEADKKRGKTIVTLAGRASRNSQEFEEKFEALRSAIERELKTKN